MDYHEKSREELIHLLEELTTKCESLSNSLEDEKNEKSKIEARLTDREGIYQVLIETILDVVYEISLDGTVLYISPVVEKSMGYKPEEIIGRNFMEFMHPDDLKWVPETMQSIMTQEDRYLEYRYFNKAGEPRWIRTASRPVFKDGTMVSIRGTLADIHDRKIAELKVIENEEKYRSLVDSLDAAIMMVDANGRFLYLNEIACRPYGRKAEELLGHRIQDFVMPLSHDQDILTNLKNVIETNTGMLIEAENLIFGQPRWFRISVQPIRDPEGKPVNVLLSVLDITLRKHTEKELLKFRTITDQANYGAAIASPDGTLIYCNQAMAQMHGWEIDELTGQPLSVFHNEFQMNKVRELLQVMATTGSFEVIEIGHVRKDGSEFPAMMHGKTIFDRENRPLMYSSTTIDITDWKQAASELRESESQLNLAQEIGGMGSWELDWATREMKWSRNMFRLLGMEYREGKMPYSEFLKRIFPEDSGILKTLPDILNQTKQAQNIDLRMVTDDGNIKWFENIILPLFDEETLTGLKGVSHDNTRQKEAEKIIRDLNANLELKIAERTQELENFFSVSLDLLCIADTDGYFLKMNKAWENVLGYPIRELENSLFLNYIHPDDLNKTQDTLQQLSESQPVHSFINRYKTNEGHYRTLEWRSTPVGNKIYAAARDITELVKAREFETELLNLSAKLTGITISEFTQAINYALAQLGTFLEVDRSYVFEFDYKNNTQSNTFEWCNDGITSEIAGLQDIPIDDFPFWFEIISRNQIINIKSVNNLTGEWEILRESLVQQGIRSLIAIPVMSGEKPLGFLGLDSVKKERDFSASEINTLKVWASMLASLFIRRQNELILQQTAEQFSTAFHTSSVMMAISKFEEGNFIDINAEFSEVMGFHREELMGRTNRELQLFTDPDLRDEIIRKLKDRIPVRKIEVEMRSKNGKIKTGLLSADSYYIEGQRYLLTVSIDITDRKKAEKEILLARMEAEKANLAKSEFLSRMSHELRTPLNSILGFAQLLELGELNPGQSKGVKHIINSGKHLLDLINEVLDITKIEAGKLSLSIEPVKVNSIIHEMLDIVQPLASERKIEVGLKLDTDEDCFVRADRQRLKQVLINLIHNAIKYNREEGFVTIIAKELIPRDHENPVVRIIVKDTGIGISKAEMHKLFLPFERMGAEKTAMEGSGLGLTVVKKLVDAMEGVVGVDSEEGIGSEFWFELQVSEKPSTLSQPKGNHTKQSPWDHQKQRIILYVEDNTSNIELIEHIISSQRPNFKLVPVSQGKLVLNLTLELKPDLILLDLNLPDIHGIEVLKLLQSHMQTKDIPVMVITADAMSVRPETLFAAGAKKLLTKPIDLHNFLMVFDQILGN